MSGMSAVMWITILMLLLSLGLLGFAFGILHERKNWNKLIDKGVIPRPQNSQKSAQRERDEDFMVGLSLTWDESRLSKGSKPWLTFLKTFDYGDCCLDIDSVVTFEGESLYVLGIERVEYRLCKLKDYPKVSTLTHTTP